MLLLADDPWFVFEPELVDEIGLVFYGRDCDAEDDLRLRCRQCSATHATMSESLRICKAAFGAVHGHRDRQLMIQLSIAANTFPVRH